jgi:hypothetical protein
LATLNNVWDEEHGALNMVTVVCNELDTELSDGFYYVIYLNLLSSVHPKNDITECPLHPKVIEDLVP